MLLLRHFSPTLNVFLNVILLWTGSQQFIISCISVFTVTYIYILFCVCACLIARKISTREAIPTKLCCCILRGPGWEHILDIVPGGTELGTQDKTGSRAGRTHPQQSPKKSVLEFCCA